MSEVSGLTHHGFHDLAGGQKSTFHGTVNLLDDKAHEIRIESRMKGWRKIWRREQPYQLIEAPSPDEEDVPEHDVNAARKKQFSIVDYAIFLLLGIAMLWSWNMFLAAGPYFQQRFRSNRWIFDNFQAAEMSVSTVTNLSSMLVLAKLQRGASYPRRILLALGVYTAVFAFLAASTSIDGRAKDYFGFVLVMILFTSLATALCQNGIFAYVAGFGEPRYTQGIMTGQAIAGVLPCVAQIVSVLSVQGDDTGAGPDGENPGTPQVRRGGALAYFSTATGVAIITSVAFVALLARHRRPAVVEDAGAEDSSPESGPEKEIPLWTLWKKLSWLAAGVFLTFGITMVFPVYTQRIVSVWPPAELPPIMQPASFIPLAFLFWNVGDLLGRLLTAVPSLSLVHHPRLVFTLAVSRVAFLGLYHLCNIRGDGAVVHSDLFYLVVVQLLFGLTNGFVGSTCMIGAAEWVDEEEREAAGGFMGLCLVAGLATGSLASFIAAGA